MDERCENCRFWKRLGPLQDHDGEIENNMGI